MYRYFSCLGAEDISFDSDEITYVKQFLEHAVVQSLVFSRANLVTLYIYLDASL